MRRLSRSPLGALVVLPLLLAAVPAMAQVSYTGGTYRQNFDLIGTNATATLPPGFRAQKLTGARNAAATYTSGVTATELRSGNSMSSTAGNGIYNYGAGDPTAVQDRAVGFISSGSGTQTGHLMLGLANNTGASITSFSIAYDAERYRDGTNAAGFSIRMYYSTNGTTWSEILNPISFTGGQATNNGFSLAPGQTLSQNATTYTPGATVADGSTVYFSWSFSVTTGTTTTNAQALGIDNIVITSSLGATRTVTQTSGNTRGWRLLGTPVNGATVNTLIGLNLVQGITGEWEEAAANTNLFTGYNGNNSDNTNASTLTGTNAGFTKPAGTSTALTPGRGFLWYMFDDTQAGPTQTVGAGQASFKRALPFNFTATGPANQGTYTTIFTASERSVPDDGFYMLANPYAADFDLTNLRASSGTLSANAEVLNPNGTFSNRIIASASVAEWQGFFVQMTSPTFPLTFTFSDQTSTNATFVGKNFGADEQAILPFTLTGQTERDVRTYDDGAWVSFVADASREWDRFDLSKLYPVSAPYAILSPVGAPQHEGEAETKAVESLPLGLAEVTEVPMRVNITHAGTYTIAWPDLTVLPVSWSLTLLDRKTGVTTNLRTASQYRFTSMAAMEEDRFALTIDPRISSSVDRPVDAGAFSIRPFANPLRAATHLRVEVAAPGPLSVQVVDLLGRTVATLHDGPAALGSVALAFDPAGLPAGLYVVRAVAAGATASRTFVVAR